MDPDKASQELDELMNLIQDTYPVEVVEQHLGASAGGSKAKQVPELPPAAKKQVPKAKKSNPATSKVPWKPSPVPEGMADHDPQTPSQQGSDTEPSSADDDSEASPKGAADKKARPTFPPPLPPDPPKLQHFIAQGLGCAPPLPADPPKMQHFMAQGLGSACWPLPPPCPPSVAASARQPLPPTSPPSVAAYARQAVHAVTQAVKAVESYNAASSSSSRNEGGDDQPPENWREIIENGDIPPGLPPGYPAVPPAVAKRQAPWREPHASPIAAPPLASRIASSMAGILNIPPPPPAIIPGSQQARPTIAPRVMPPPPAVVPANRNAEIPSVVPTQAPSTRTTGPNRESGGVRRNWEKQLRYATKKGPEARKAFLRKYGNWFPTSREDDDEFLLQFRRDNPDEYIRCA